MLSLDDLDNMRAIVDEARDGRNAYPHFLAALLPVVPPMVGGLIVELLEVSGDDHIIHGGQNEA